MNAAQVVDDFVQAINSRPNTSLPLEEVPEHLRAAPADLEGYTNWKIVRSDNSREIAALEDILKKRFPPSYKYLISNYSFPEFEVGPVMLFANTGKLVFHELSSRLFQDPALSPILLEDGFLQIGNPEYGDYDPICFDLSRSRDEHPLVRIDHESVIQHKQSDVTEEIAASFIDFIKKYTDEPTRYMRRRLQAE